MLPTLLLLVGLAAASSPDAATLALLQQGEIVVRSSGDGDDMASQAWVLVDAPPDRIWALVSDPDHLRASASNIQELVVHSDRTLPDGRREQKLGYVIKVGFSTIRYNVVRIYDYGANRMSWTLDTTRDNDIVATDGVFQLSPGPDGGTLFTYRLSADSGRAVPAWVQDQLTAAGLKRFLRYVQQQA